jgi:hypothetical protein
MVSQLAPVRRITLSGEVADRLSEAIRSGEFPPGTRLPVGVRTITEFDAMTRHVAYFLHNAALSGADWTVGSPLRAATRPSARARVKAA